MGTFNDVDLQATIQIVVQGRASAIGEVDVGAVFFAPSSSIAPVGVIPSGLASHP